MRSQSILSFRNSLTSNWQRFVIRWLGPFDGSFDFGIVFMLFRIKQTRKRNKSNNIKEENIRWWSRRKIVIELRIRNEISDSDSVPLSFRHKLRHIHHLSSTVTVSDTRIRSRNEFKRLPITHGKIFQFEKEMIFKTNFQSERHYERVLWSINIIRWQSQRQNEGTAKRTGNIRTNATMNRRRTISVITTSSIQRYTFEWKQFQHKTNLAVVSADELWMCVCVYMWLWVAWHRSRPRPRGGTQ